MCSGAHLVTNMVSIILVAWSVGMLYAGFQLGAKYKTLKEMKRSVGAKISELLNK